MCCGVVCGWALAVEGCLSEAVAVLEHAVRARAPGSLLRVSHGGRDYYIGLGALPLALHPRLHRLCVARSVLACFELCLAPCPGGSGAAFIAYAPGAARWGPALCPARRP